MTPEGKQNRLFKMLNPLQNTVKTQFCLAPRLPCVQSPGESTSGQAAGNPGCSSRNGCSGLWVLRALGAQHCTLLLQMQRQQPLQFIGSSALKQTEGPHQPKKGYKQFCIIVDVWKRCKTSDTIRFILRSIKNHPVKKQARLLEEEVEEAF